MTRTAKDQLTPKEEELMQLLWEHGPIAISRLVELYPEPRPHFNTVSTVMRRLEAKGFVAHEDTGGTFRYHAKVAKEYFRSRRANCRILDMRSDLTTTTRSLSSMV